MKEASIQKRSVQWLRGQGCICIKLSTLGRYGTQGWPDYLVLFEPNGHWFAEFKAPGKQLTPLQERRKAELEAHGHHVYVCMDVMDAIHAYTEETKWYEKRRSTGFV